MRCHFAVVALCLSALSAPALAVPVRYAQPPLHLAPSTALLAPRSSPFHAIRSARPARGLTHLAVRQGPEIEEVVKAAGPGKLAKLFSHFSSAMEVAGGFTVGVLGLGGLGCVHLLSVPSSSLVVRVLMYHVRRSTEKRSGSGISGGTPARAGSTCSTERAGIGPGRGAAPILCVLRARRRAGAGRSAGAAICRARWCTVVHLAGPSGVVTTRAGPGLRSGARMGRGGASRES